MPGYQDHLLFGSLLVLVFAYVMGPLLSYGTEALLVSAAFILLAAVFPDVDHAGSVVHRKLGAFITLLAASIPAILLYPDVPLMVGGAGLAGISTAYLFEAVKPHHRGITHTYPAAVVFSAVSGAIAYLLFATFVPALFTFVAYLSHIVLDRATTEL